MPHLHAKGLIMLGGHFGLPPFALHSPPSQEQLFLHSLIRSFPHLLFGMVVGGGAVLTPSALHGLHCSFGQPASVVVFSVPHLHAKGLIMLGGHFGFVGFGGAVFPPSAFVEQAPSLYLIFLQLAMHAFPYVLPSEPQTGLWILGHMQNFGFVVALPPPMTVTISFWPYWQCP